MLLLDITIHKASFINVISVIDKIDDLELIFRNSGMCLFSSTLMDYLDINLVIMKDKFESYFCNTNEIRLFLCTSNLYHIINNIVGDKIRFTMDEKNDDDDDDEHILMISDSLSCDVYSNLIVTYYHNHMFDNININFYKNATIFKIRLSILKELVSYINKSSDIIYISCVKGILLFSYNNITTEPKVKLIELGVDVNINKTILLNPIVECCNLLSSCVFLIISCNNIRIAYKIKELGTLYLNFY